MPCGQTNAITNAFLGARKNKKANRKAAPPIHADKKDSSKVEEAVIVVGHPKTLHQFIKMELLLQSRRSRCLFV